MQPREHVIDVLSFHARVIGPRSVIDLADRLFPRQQFRTTGNPTQPIHTIEIEHSSTVAGAWEVIEHGVEPHVVLDFDDLATLLAWIINTKAVQTLARDYLLFHAGAVAFEQVGIILPGRSGSGKSTLTAGLAAEGCAYFSDEAAVISPTCGSILPFAKAIKIEPDSLPVLRSRYPELSRIDDRSRRTTYLRPPDGSWPHAPVQPNFVVFPRYEAGATTRIEDMSRAEGFARLMDHAFSGNNQGADGVRQTVRLLERCTCHNLSIGNLDDAVNLVLELGKSAR